MKLKKEVHKVLVMVSGRLSLNSAMNKIIKNVLINKEHRRKVIHRSHQRLNIFKCCLVKTCLEKNTSKPPVIFGVKSLLKRNFTDFYHHSRRFESYILNIYLK